MQPDLYQEILESKKEDLYPNEYYSVPLVMDDIMHILSLLKKDYSYKLYDEIRTFLNEEYDLNIQC